MLQLNEEAVVHAPENGRSFREWEELQGMGGASGNGRSFSNPVIASFKTQAKECFSNVKTNIAQCVTNIQNFPLWKSESNTFWRMV